MRSLCWGLNMAKSDLYDLQKSMKAIGQLYPVLLDSTGEYIIDGVHRLEANPKWKRIKLGSIKDKREILVARIISNVCRREISSYEKSELFNELAEFLIKDEEVPIQQVTRTISQLTGVSYRTVSRYLSTKFKDQNKARVRQKFDVNLAANLDEINGIVNYKEGVEEIKFFTIGKKDNQHVTISKCLIKPDEKNNLHSHSSNFYWYCLKGSGTCRLGSREYEVKKGTLLYCSKYTPSQIHNSDNDYLDAICFWSPPIRLSTLYFEDKCDQII